MKPDARDLLLALVASILGGVLVFGLTYVFGGRG